MVKRKNNHKRGSVEDLLFIMMVMIVIAVVTLIVFKVSNSINTNIQAGTEFTTEGKEAFAKVNSTYSGVLDGGFLFLAIGLSIIAIVMASLIRVHPVFIVFFLIALVILIFVSAIFSNLYQAIAGQPDMLAEANQLVFISLIMRRLPLIIGIIGSVLAIVMYKGWEGAQQ